MWILARFLVMNASIAINFDASGDSEKPTLAFIMLNPSTADEVEDDPTIRRCVGYAEDWGYGELIVGNLYAYRTSDPEELNKVENPIGPKNDQHLENIYDEADKVVVAWGQTRLSGIARQRSQSLLVLLYALDTTKHGHPNHPLYQPKDVEPRHLGTLRGRRVEYGIQLPVPNQ